MGEAMTCPLCGRTHPEGTTFCDVMWADIPQTPIGREPDEERGETPCQGDAEEPSSGRCPACGAAGVPGDECWQCGSIIESRGQGPCEPSVLLRVEGGPGVRVEPGKTIVIGREGSSTELNRILEAYDAVSRRHCSVRLSQDATTATVTDNGSTNGTFVGQNATRLEKGETCTMKLPAQIRLGSCVNVTLETEG